MPPTSSAASSSDGPAPGEAERVSLGLIRVMKLMQAMRQHAPRLHPGVDSAAYPLLFHLDAAPRRVSALADCVHSDVSTVSRQVSTLVTHRLLEKVTDPDDRRAQVVRLSDEGQALLVRIQQHRHEWFTALLQGWTTEEAADFADHLERFGGTLQAAREVAIGRAPTDPGTASTTDSPSAPGPTTTTDTATATSAREATAPRATTPQKAN